MAQRYEHEEEGMVPYSAGDYVEHSDYEKLEARVGELEEKIEKAKEALE